MILTAHQPVYLPWIGLFHKIAISDVYLFMDNVKYLKQDWNNRNKIKTSDGSLWLTVPVGTKGSDNFILKDVRIENNHKWNKKHWLSMQNFYRRAPYFKYYAHFFEEVYSKKWDNLVDINLYMLNWFLETLGIATKVIIARDFNFKGIKSDLILDICLQLNANQYVFGCNGINYADIENFHNYGIKPFFQSYIHPVYNQLHGNFIPYMSIVDLLFNEGPRSMEIIMSGNITKETLLERIH
jgi:hypothetical protein